MVTPLRILVVDDSPTARQMLERTIESAPDLCLVGLAADGKSATRLACDLHPDLILMDLVMPEMDGLEATREIMHLAPTPIVMVSAGLEASETDIVFQAIRMGALTAVQKPVGPLHAEHEAQVKALLNTVRAMASVKVIHHWPTKRPPTSSQPTHFKAVAPRLVAIVASTGGPAAIAKIVQNLPADFATPIVILQHISEDFVLSLCGWLAGLTLLKIELAQQGKIPRPGHIYLAPGNAHLRLSAGQAFELDMQQRDEPHMPSGNMLLMSVARSYGAHAVGVVLTGMGSDGARGLRAMHDAGAFTIAQDEATSAVYGMPREAAKLGAVRRVVPLQAIAQTLVDLSRLRTSKDEARLVDPGHRG